MTTEFDRTMPNHLSFSIDRTELTPKAERDIISSMSRFVGWNLSIPSRQHPPFWARNWRKNHG